MNKSNFLVISISSPFYTKRIPKRYNNYTLNCRSTPQIHFNSSTGKIQITTHEKNIFWKFCCIKILQLWRKWWLPNLPSHRVLFNRLTAQIGKGRKRDYREKNYRNQAEIDKSHPRIQSQVVKVGSAKGKPLRQPDSPLHSDINYWVHWYYMNYSVPWYGQYWLHCPLVLY